MEAETRDIRRKLEMEMSQRQELDRELELKNRQVSEMKEIGRKIVEYENQLQIIGQERERLEQNLRNKNNELMEASNAINNYEYELDGMRRRIGGL